METKRKIDKRTWNTYAIGGYTRQVGNDPRATGGVHRYEVRRAARGWQRRVSDSNGCWDSPGIAEAIDDATGEALFAQAKAY